ncbi:hypothetical protein ATCC90586_002839 [Pythium insidiosum]|nr:hypothetical protein ATCC90586_002839 [Pythium insidiosum]
MDPSEVTVLVVEDDEFTRIATIDILKSCRYSVDAVENGQEALELLQSNHAKYDLVLCDMMLPVMNGIELLDALQKQSATLGHIPVVMTSSNEEMDVVTTCLSKGAKDYLIKPIQVNTAKTLVRHVWLSRRLERPSTKSVWQDLEVIRTIGKGTHGTVVLARRKVDGAVVAVKRVRTSQISESGRKQADNEVILLKSLYHVNIVRFYDHFLVDDELNIVMEYADGGNLRQLVKMRGREKMGPFPESVIMCWFAQLVLAVAYIHGKNVLHRDLKAQNVFLTRKNVVKLGDFGISKALAGDDTANTACGTPESMSPEICRGEPYGKKSDIWSLGYIFTKICKGDYPPILPTFSRELRLLVQLMLQQDSSKRPSIEDICRFPFVQAPIQAFLSEHVAEFQEALELEAKLHQPSLYNSDPVAEPAPARPSTAPSFDLIYTLKKEFCKTEEEAYNAVAELVATKVLHLVAAESMESPELNRGGLEFTLGDIKHGILRCNRKPPANYWERQLQAQDPKLQYRLHIRDPRSLLVLIDCTEPLPSPDQVPILKPGRTDTDLEEQVEKFCARNIEVNEEAGEIVLPRVFRTFRDDFGASEGEMLSWLSQYMESAPTNMVSFRVRYRSGVSA